MLYQYNTTIFLQLTLAIDFITERGVLKDHCRNSVIKSSSLLVRVVAYQSRDLMIKLEGDIKDESAFIPLKGER